MVFNLLNGVIQCSFVTVFDLWLGLFLCQLLQKSQCTVLIITKPRIRPGVGLEFAVFRLSKGDHLIGYLHKTTSKFTGPL